MNANTIRLTEQRDEARAERDEARDYILTIASDKCLRFHLIGGMCVDDKPESLCYVCESAAFLARPDTRKDGE